MPFSQLFLGPNETDSTVNSSYVFSVRAWLFLNPYRPASLHFDNFLQAVFDNPASIKGREMFFGRGIPNFDGQNCFDHVDKHMTNSTEGLRRVLVIRMIL